MKVSTQGVVTTDDLTETMLEAIEQLQAAHADLEESGRRWTIAENAYRMAKAKAYQIAEGTVQARQAEVDLHTENERLACHQAEADKISALELVRSLRAQLSAIQTIANSVREEIGFAKTGGQT